MDRSGVTGRGYGITRVRDGVVGGGSALLGKEREKNKKNGDEDTVDERAVVADESSDEVLWGLVGGV